MTHPPAIARRGHRRVPAFLPVPLRTRSDGWTPMRQAAFLGALAETGSVLAAARRVGLSRETAYRLRRKPGAESFAAAWDAVMGRPQGGSRKVTAQALARRALHGLLKPLIYRGRHVATIEKADNSALLRLLSQLDRANCAGRIKQPQPPGFTPRSVSTGDPARSSRSYNPLPFSEQSAHHR